MNDKKCPICSGKYTLNQVLKKGDPDIDNALCQQHLQALFEVLP